MQTIYRPLYAFYGNCILYGSLDEELKFDSAASNSNIMEYHFKNCLIKTTHGPFPGNQLENCILNKDPLFGNPASPAYASSNYEVSQGPVSPAIATADATIAGKYDTALDGKRMPPYVIGAYQQ